MKKQLVLLILMLPPILFAQSRPPAGLANFDGRFLGGIGVTAIDDKIYYNIVFQPEISIGKLGAGLNIDLLYNPEPDSGESRIRSEDLKLEKVLRYVRWGHKKDPLYARVGALDNTTLGHGFILRNYQNQVVENERKLGLEFDVDANLLGFESMTSSFKRLELTGGRAYMRPLKKIILIPIVNSIALGCTYVTDMDPDANTGTADEVVIMGADAELPIIEAGSLNVAVYGDYAQITDFGSGFAVGVQVLMPSLFNMMHATLNVEERFLGDQFRSQYFNAFYELERPYKRASLADAKAIRGTFGELLATVQQKVTVTGSYEYFQETNLGGIAHAEALLEPNAVPHVVANASYDKIYIETFEDLITLDDNSLAQANVGIGLTSYLYVTLNYQWTFHRDENDDLIVIEKMTPRIDFQFAF